MSDPYNRVVLATTSRVVAQTTDHRVARESSLVGEMQNLRLMASITNSLGELVCANPSATRLFLRHRLVFCCGGRRTLAQACEAKGLDPVQVLSELEREAAGSPPERPERWEARSLTALADHIELRYHAALRRDLPSLVEAARRVERVHAGEPCVPAGLAAVLTELLEDIERHMAKEEMILFPMIRRGARGEAVYMPVRVMESEHDIHGRQLAKVRELTRDLQLPPNACATWRALYDGLEALEADVMEHIHLENNVLFARATREG
jgi:regulator of cell morphogenesis and NO signaling